MFLWVTRPLWHVVCDSNTVTPGKEYFDEFIAVMSYPCCHGLADTLVQHIEQCIIQDNTKPEADLLVMLLLSAMISSARCLPDASLACLIESAENSKHSLSVINLYIIYVYGTSEEDEACVAAARLRRMDKMYDSLDRVGLSMAFQRCMVSCLALKLSGDAKKFTDFGESIKIFEDGAMWKDIVVRTHMSVEDIVFVAQCCTSITEESFRTTCSMIFCSMEGLNGCHVSAIGFICAWMRQLNSSSQVIMMKMLCNSLSAVRIGQESYTTSLQYLLFNLVLGNSSGLQLDNSESHYLLGYLSPKLASATHVLSDTRCQLQWLSEIWTKQLSSMNILPILAVYQSLDPDCCALIFRTLKTLLSAYFGKNLNSNVYNTSAGRRFNVGSLSSKQVSRHSLSGYKEEFMPSLTEHWEAVIYLMGLLCCSSSTGDRSAKDLSLYLESMVVGVRKNEASTSFDSKSTMCIHSCCSCRVYFTSLFRSLGALQEALDAAWDVVCPSPFTGMKIRLKIFLVETNQQLAFYFTMQLWICTRWMPRYTFYSSIKFFWHFSSLLGTCSLLPRIHCYWISCKAFPHYCMEAL